MKRIILIILLILFAYYNSLFSDFIYDDYFVIVNNDFIKSWKNIPLVFNQRYLSQPNEMTFDIGAYNIGAGETTYRPVVTLSYFLNYALFKLQPWGYRLTNILLHIINAILIYLLLNALFGNQRLSLFSAILFGIHPINAEVLNCSAFRPNMLTFLFSLLSIILYFKYKEMSGRQRRAYLSFSLFSFLLAVFSKEISVILPLALIVCDIFYVHFDFRKILGNFRIYLLYFIIDIFYLLVYFLVFPPQQIVLKSSIAYYDLLGNLLRMFDVVGIYLKDILFPKDLVPVFGNIPISYLRVIVATILILLCAYVVLRKSKTSKEFSFSILWFFIWLLPMNNFIYTTRIHLAHRYLYISFLGFTTAFSILLTKVWDRNSIFLSNMLLLRRVLVFSCLVYLLIFTVSGNVNWRNDFFLYSSACQRHPLSATAHSGLAVALLRYGNDQEAENEFNRVLSLSEEPELFRPFSFGLASVYLARFYRAKGKYSEAEQLLLRALRVFPNSARIYTELGICHNQQGLYKKALGYFNKAKEINPNFTPAYINCGMSYKLMDKYSDAKNEFLKALEIYPESKEARDNLDRLEAISKGK